MKKKDKEEKPLGEVALQVNAVSEPVVMSIEGFLDGVEDGRWAAGWVRDKNSSTAVLLTIAIDEEEVGHEIADQFREDLKVVPGTGGNCAFWFEIPAQYADNMNHKLEVYSTESKQQLTGSPVNFKLSPPESTVVIHRANAIDNADFSNWPFGLVMKPKSGLTPLFPGWYFETKKNIDPKTIISPDKLTDIALMPGQYAMNVTIESGDNGYRRLVAVLETDVTKIIKQRFSLGVRRQASAAHGDIHIKEISICTLQGETLKRVSSLQRSIRPRGTQRIKNIPIAQDPELFTGIANTATLALVIEFSGTGSLTLFSPEIIENHQVVSEPAEILGQFEDPHIRNQINNLILSPIWRSEKRAAAITPSVEAKVIPSIPRAKGSSGVPFIQIVIPVFNAVNDLEELLRSIITSTNSPFEIIISDDGSEEFTHQRICQWESMDSRIRYFRQPTNIGYTRNINTALQSAVAEFVVLINSDTIVAPGWLRKLHQVLDQHPETVAVGPLSNAASWQSIPRTKGSDGKWFNNEFPPSWSIESINTELERLFDGEYPVFPLLNGFCTMFRKSALEKVGFYDDLSFPRGYGEENDLCLRLGLMGYSLRVAPDTFVRHKKSKSFGSKQREELSKKANAILKTKHPSINFQQVEDGMKINPTINSLRAHFLKVLLQESVASNSGAYLNSEIFQSSKNQILIK